MIEVIPMQIVKIIRVLLKHLTLLLSIALNEVSSSTFS